jgi:hypothetical protein
MYPLRVPLHLISHRVGHNKSSEMIIKFIQPTAQSAPAQHRRYSRRVGTAAGFGVVPPHPPTPLLQFDTLERYHQSRSVHRREQGVTAPFSCNGLLRTGFLDGRNRQFHVLRTICIIWRVTFVQEGNACQFARKIAYAGLTPDTSTMSFTVLTDV